MIISASRRTDIPAFYSDWFINRIKEGYVDVINPFNIKLVSRVILKPELVTCIVFWSKNPRPLLDRIDEIKDYRYYFQFTLNGYDKDIEVGLPDKNEIINTFIELSKKIGKEKVIWRYDPIFINDKYTLDYHINKFTQLAELLNSYTTKCVISFIDLYDKTKRNMYGLNIRALNNEEMNIIADKFSKICKKYNLKLATCSEKIDLDKYGIEHNKCIDNELIENLFHVEVTNKKDDQRKECGCVKCVDIGAYNTCLHKCKYCYATFNQMIADRNQALVDPNSSVLLGRIDKNAKIYPAKQEVVKPLIKQIELEF